MFRRGDKHLPRRLMNFFYRSAYNSSWLRKDRGQGALLLRICRANSRAGPPLQRIYTTFVARVSERGCRERRRAITQSRFSSHLSRVTTQYLYFNRATTRYREYAFVRADRNSTSGAWRTRHKLISRTNKRDSRGYFTGDRRINTPFVLRWPLDASTRRTDCMTGTINMRTLGRTESDRSVDACLNGKIAQSSKQIYFNRRENGS